ncbi:hypothetical protein N7G274_001632 [Stereocaulon virgatum]|uniref:Uncharacterized protein n=1 Tax=Stereocaulon virgatum TaxID=373712 RepID=A0ABR4ALU7_9LECA
MKDNVVRDSPKTIRTLVSYRPPRPPSTVATGKTVVTTLTTVLMTLPPPTVALTMAPTVVDGFVVVSTVATVVLPELLDIVERMVPTLLTVLETGVVPSDREPETVTIDAVDATVDMIVNTIVIKGVGVGKVVAGVLEVVEGLRNEVLAIPELVVPAVLVPETAEGRVDIPELVDVGLLPEAFGVVLLVAGVLLEEVPLDGILLDGLLVNRLLVAWLLVNKGVPGVFVVGVIGPGVVLPEMVVTLFTLGIVVVFRVFVGVEMKVGVCTTEKLEMEGTENADVKAAETVGVRPADMAVVVVSVETTLIEVIEIASNVVLAALPAVGAGNSPRLTQSRSEHPELSDAVREVVLVEVPGVDVTELIEAVGNVVPAVLPAVGVGDITRETLEALATERLIQSRSEHPELDNAGREEVVVEATGVDVTELIEAVGNVVPAVLPAVGVGDITRETLEALATERLIQSRSEHPELSDAVHEVVLVEATGVDVTELIEAVGNVVPAVLPAVGI